MSIDTGQLQSAIAAVQTAMANYLANPTPNVSMPDGTSVAGSEYMKMLTEQLEALNKLSNAVNPFIVRTRISL